MKCYMKINNERFGMELERTKTFLVGRIAKEDARSGSWIVFVNIL